MSEDETFNTLRRIPYKDLMVEVGQQPLMFNDQITLPLSAAEVEWLSKRGWSEIAFKKGWGEWRLNRNPEIVKYDWYPNFIEYIKNLENG